MAQQEELVNNQHEGNELPQGQKKPFISKKVSDHLANERTFLAWIRTGISVMAFGFVVERFGLLLRELGLRSAGAGKSNNTISYSRLLGIGITLLGIVLLIIALLNFIRIQRSIDEERYHPGIVFAIVLTVIASIIGILLAIYLSVTT
ncbi:MAG: YidH family protein [Ktedonobacteraceae bacterium]